LTVIELDVRRRERVGGSEAAAACGVDPFRSRVHLWAEKMGMLEREPTEAMQWGTRLQPVIAAELEARGYDVLPAPADDLQHPTLRWLAGHPDGYVKLDGERALLEIKTTSPWAMRDWHDDGSSPIAYVVQCHHYMLLTQTHTALLAALVGGQRLLVRTVHFDERLAETMLELEHEFVEYVRRQTPPPPNGSDSARDALRALYPEASERVARLTGEAWHDFRELRRRREQLAIVEQQVAELTQRVQLAMGDATAAVSPRDQPACRWTNVHTTRLDTKALKAARPDLYAEFSHTTTTRRFTIE
jgi:putative phage-type endonuclease